MTKTQFFVKYGNLLINAAKDSAEYGDFLFLHPEEINLVQCFNADKFQVVSVHETEDEKDYVDMSIPCDFGSQPFKYGYFVISKP